MRSPRDSITNQSLNFECARSLVTSYESSALFSSSNALKSAESSFESLAVAPGWTAMRKTVGCTRVANVSVSTLRAVKPPSEPRAWLICTVVAPLRRASVNISAALSVGPVAPAQSMAPPVMGSAGSRGSGKTL